jgi:hypothetical protein
MRIFPRKKKTFDEYKYSAIKYTIDQKKNIRERRHRPAIDTINEVYFIKIYEKKNILKIKKT